MKSASMCHMATLGSPEETQIFKMDILMIGAPIIGEIWPNMGSASPLTTQATTPGMLKTIASHKFIVLASLISSTYRGSTRQGNSSG
jgi:hypothetical protein